MNPCTLGWYLPLIVKDLPGALQPSDRDRDPPGPGGAGGSSSRDDSARPNGHKVRDGGANGASSYDIDHPAANSAGQSTSAAGQPVQDGGTSGLVGNKHRPQGSHKALHARAGTGGGGGVTWQDLDAKFRRDLPDEAYVGRLGYRGLVMRACPAIRMLDGVEVSAKERDKAERLLKSVLDAPGVDRKATQATSGAKEAASVTG